MGVNSDDFENHGDRISADYNDEIAYRCTISRKYYHIFHKLRETYPSYFDFGPGDHGKAKKLIRENVDKQLADDLDDLHSDRKDADYDIDDNIEELDLQTFEHDLNEFILEAKSQGLF
jgi:uncharacterized protein (UPF0332 family)